MQTITEKSLQVLNFIALFQSQNGYSPSIPEIMDGAKINSVRGVSMQLEKLQRLGYLQRGKNSRRAIKILNKPEHINSTDTTKIPLVGEVKAGYNALAEANIEAYYNVPLNILHGRKDAFLLRVKGNSMLKAGFSPGDIVVVIPQTNPLNGDIVVAFNPNDDTATLKRYKKLDDYILLLPESDDPTYQPVVGREFIIQGKVINKFNPTSSDLSP
jgi:repressor LexA